MSILGSNYVPILLEDIIRGHVSILIYLCTIAEKRCVYTFGVDGVQSLACSEAQDPTAANTIMRIHIRSNLLVSDYSRAFVRPVNNLGVAVSRATPIPHFAALKGLWILSGLLYCRLILVVCGFGIDG